MKKNMSTKNGCASKTTHGYGVKKIKFILLTSIIVVLFFNLIPVIAQKPADFVGPTQAESESCPAWLAQIGIKDGCIIPIACTQSPAGDVNSCGLSQVFQVIVNVSQLILAFTGSAALLMFTYGGILWIIAAGNQERIQKGKTAITSAVIGIAIILGSWLIVNTLIVIITGGEVGSGPAQLLNQTWSEEPKVDSK